MGQFCTKINSLSDAIWGNISYNLELIYKVLGC